jgi:type VI secretion system protein ImpE
MSAADEAIEAGDVAAARAALIDEVRAKPDDRAARMFLIQVQMVLGEWDKALTHIRTLANLSPEAMTFQAAYDRLIAAERQREAVFKGQARAEALAEGGPWFGQLIDALAADASGDAETATRLRAQAYDEAPETPGEADGHRFEFIADTDARLGPALEVIIDGRYGLVPFEAITLLESEGAKDLRDIVWLPVRLTLKSGRSGAVFIPTRYPGAGAEADGMLKLARRTEWDERGDLGNAGRGQRVLDAGGADIDLLTLRRLTFEG